MQIHTTARHLEVDREVKAFAEKRLQRLERFAGDIREAHLILSGEKNRTRAEVILKLNRREMVARQEAHDVRASIDGAVERLERQLMRLKERRSSHGKGLDRRARGNGNVPGTDEAGESPPGTGLADGGGPE